MRIKRRHDKGQGMTEYIIIVALIAIAAIGITMLFGDNIRGIFSAEANALAGNESTTPNTRNATIEEYGHRSLHTFGQNKPKL